MPCLPACAVHIICIFLLGIEAVLQFEVELGDGKAVVTYEQ